MPKTDIGRSGQKYWRRVKVGTRKSMSENEIVGLRGRDGHSMAVTNGCRRTCGWVSGTEFATT